jgi:hypothetical protein
MKQLGARFLGACVVAMVVLATGSANAATRA